MKIYEAIQSGKRYKRKGSKEWKSEDQSGEINGDSVVSLTIHDILADDWETDEERRKITASDLAKAWDARVSGKSNLKDSKKSDDFIGFLSQLGFRP